VAAAKDRRPATDSAEGEVYYQLAEANLLRLRRQWDEAIAKCVQVLRQYPNNPTAHSLLGDIYRDQKQYPDAIEWYKLAVELDPTSRPDRVKLDQLLDRVYTETRETKASSAPSKASGAVQRVWRDAKLAKPVRVGMITALAVLVVVLIVALIVWQVRRPPMRVAGQVGSQTPNPVTAGAGSAAGRPASGENQPQAVEVPSVPGATGAAPTPGVAGAPAPVPDRYGQLEGALFEALTKATTKAAHGNWRVAAVSVDPRTLSVRVSFSVRSGRPEETKRRILQACSALARAALDQRPNLPVFVFEAYAAERNMLGREGTPEKVFVAELAGSALSDRAALPDPEHLLPLLHNVWWSKDLEGASL
jgi:hypothetical protein